MFGWIASGFSFVTKWAGDKLVLIGGGLLLALTVAFSLRQAGKQAERLKGLQETIKAVGVKNEVRDNVSRMSDSERKRLRKKWTRD